MKLRQLFSSTWMAVSAASLVVGALGNYRGLDVMPWDHFAALGTHAPLILLLQVVWVAGWGLR